MDILMINSKEPLSIFYQKMLINAGYSVDIAHSLRDGFKMTRKLEYDLIVLASKLNWKEFVDTIVVLREESKETKILTFQGQDLSQNVNMAKCADACSIQLIQPGQPTLVELLENVNNIFMEGSGYSDSKVCA